MSENEPPEVPATALGPIRPLSVRITDGLRARHNAAGREFFFVNEDIDWLAIRPFVEDVEIN
ncbi:hypothetical protein HDC37_000824 [Microbacterium sp. AK009]|uniref:hypothetical protein n=1 Tax=Microbacterium sp. AK009 TaxID=2723068 RepID=UPI0015CABFE2|nr:hypothetical protein [Microbacterium sp. AK009]NYF16010.1 hypothetical protein [Microbacterium sp. AK009]